MTEHKIKMYKNPDRNTPDKHEPYIPQYQVEGKEPIEYRQQRTRGEVVNVKATKPLLPSPPPQEENIRMRRPLMPYAETTSTLKGSVPNVGNNMEHSWSSVDSEIIDDISGQYVDPSTQMIDNNDYYTSEALGTGFQHGNVATDLQQLPKGKVVIEETKTEQMNTLGYIASVDSPDVLSALSDLTADTLLLIVSGAPICSGSKTQIEEQVRSFVFGDNEMCHGKPIDPKEIIVLKKIDIKVGVFLE